MTCRTSWQTGFCRLIFVCIALSPARAWAQAETGEKVYQRGLRATVWILAPRGDHKLATGTGSIIDLNRRLILTNYHVVGDDAQVFVLFPLFRQGKPIAERADYFQRFREGTAARARVRARDLQHDLAVLELDSPAPSGSTYLRLAKESPSPGQRVHSIGNPGLSGALWVYTSGTVRAVYHKQWEAGEGSRVMHFNAEVVETQSPTNQGDSGGPLLNDRGDLVAVTQGYNSAGQLLSLFVDVTEVRNFLAARHLLAKLPGPSSPDVMASTKAKGEGDTAAIAKDNPQQAEEKATTKLKHTRTLVEVGRLEKAKERCEEIINDYPNTKAATEAKLLLDKLNNK
jgi:hypothetical protein